ncbi:MAG: glycerophosphodiester phosphodiesterase [Gemmatimonadota bacterium]
MIGPPRPGHPYLAGKPLFFAHRGGAKLAPENTLEAFRSAVDRWGADILEMDVRLTRDGEIVVIHDEAVDRTTDGSGPVASFTLAELERLDAGARFLDLKGRASFRGCGVRVPRFEDVLDAFPRTRLNVDAKDPASLPPLLALLRRRRDQHRVLLAAVEEEGRADRHGYEGPTSATRRQLRLFYVFHRFPGGGPYIPPVDALQIPDWWKERRVTSLRLLREAHRRNIAVHVWTVDDPVVMRELLAWGVDGIQTDRPDLLARVLHQETGRPLPPGHLEEGGGSP